MAPSLWILAAALVLDAIIGDPSWLWRRLPHPVVLMGTVIAAFDRGLNRSTWPGPARRLAGVVAVLVLVGGAAALGWGLMQVPGATVIALVLATVFLAQNSLFRHVRAVAVAFRAGDDLTAARHAVAQIVGRDPDSLDRAGICRAAIESCAENFSDGIVAPALWFAVAGLPGLLVYKAVNTADSMIGHRTPRYRAFGWAAARLDDLLNLPASRLAGALVTLAAPAGFSRRPGCGWHRAWQAMMRDAPRHRSPNAGWPEAAMAGALGLALAGPRQYHGAIVDDHWMGDGGDPEAVPTDIQAALRVYAAACALLMLLIIGLAVVAAAGTA
ncbi:MAG: adenosylcobinamide-phosphate synthase CbiB [Azospirillaceae bacterium]|nr:adenosylcobinamide-phosphate synthase CbiB [Azospirillaceae bacterium]